MKEHAGATRDLIQGINYTYRKIESLINIMMRDHPRRINQNTMQNNERFTFVTRLETSPGGPTFNPRPNHNNNPKKKNPQKKNAIKHLLLLLLTTAITFDLINVVLD